MFPHMASLKGCLIALEGLQHPHMASLKVSASASRDTQTATGKRLKLNLPWLKAAQGLVFGPQRATGTEICAETCFVFGSSYSFLGKLQLTQTQSGGNLPPKYLKEAQGKPENAQKIPGLLIFRVECPPRWAFGWAVFA